MGESFTVFFEVKCLQNSIESRVNFIAPLQDPTIFLRIRLGSKLLRKRVAVFEEDIIFMLLLLFLSSLVENSEAYENKNLHKNEKHIV